MSPKSSQGIELLRYSIGSYKETLYGVKNGLKEHNFTHSSKNALRHKMAIPMICYIVCIYQFCCTLFNCLSASSHRNGRPISHKSPLKGEKHEQ